MSEPLKSLAEYNAEGARFWAAQKPQPNGLACPSCGAELIDAEGIVAPRFPMRRVYCPSCRFDGARYVGATP